MENVGRHRELLRLEEDDLTLIAIKVAFERDPKTLFKHVDKAIGADGIVANRVEGEENQAIEARACDSRKPACAIKNRRLVAANGPTGGPPGGDANKIPLGCVAQPPFISSGPQVVLA